MDTICVTGPETCAHCGGPLWRGRASIGRPRVYCTDYCRKAAWGARREQGAVAVRVEVVERVVVQEHNLAECSRRCCQSPVAATNMLYALLKLAESGELTYGEVETRVARAPDSSRRRRASRREAAMTPLLSIEDAAAYLNIPAGSVSDHVRAGEIRHVRLGKHVRMRPEWLDDFIASCERPVVASAISIQRGRRRAKL